MNTKKFVCLVLAVLMTAVVFTGCNSTSTSTPSEEQATSAPSEEQATSTPSDEQTTSTEESSASGELETVTVVFPHALECLDDMAFYVAKEMGYFEDAGIDVQLESASNPDDVSMVAAGQADFACPSANLILSSIESGMPVKVASGYDAINIFGFSAVNGSGIETWEDLKGKSIALGDAAWQTIAVPTLVAAGIDPENDVEWVVCGDSRYQMVAEGQTDVLFTWISEYDLLLGMGYDFNYIDGNEIFPGFANSFVGNVELMESRADVYTRFFNALYKGMYFMYLNPEAAADIGCNTFPAIDTTWEGAVGTANGRIDQAFGAGGENADYYIDDVGIGYMYDEEWENLITADIGCGIISTELDPADCYTNDLLPGPMSEEDKAQVKADADAYECTSEVYKTAQN